MTTCTDCHGEPSAPSRHDGIDTPLDQRARRLTLTELELASGGGLAEQLGVRLGGVVEGLGSVVRGLFGR